MKRIFPVIIILIATLIIAVLPTEKELAIYDDTVRLHILANSDSEEDQALKLSVRDRVLKDFSYELSELHSTALAKEKLSTLIPEIKETAENTVRDMGYDYSVSVTLGEEWFDTREYEDFTLPKGCYQSLIIHIGKGEGKNWWCVMFPPLCLDIATDKSKSSPSYTDEEIRLISTSRYNVKFKLLELISESTR